MNFSKMKSALSVVLLAAICALAAASCASSSSSKSKQDAIQDCQASGNAYTTCRKWIGE